MTSRLGDEQGLVVPEGDTLTVQPIGTPGLLLVKNLGFDAPGLDTGRPSDFTTDLAVFQDGRRSPARRSGSTTRWRSAATRSTRTGSGRRRTSSSATPRPAAVGSGRCR